MAFIAERRTGFLGRNKGQAPVDPGIYQYQVPLRGAETIAEITKDGKAKVTETDIFGNSITQIYVGAKINKTFVPFVTPGHERTLLKWE